MKKFSLNLLFFYVLSIILSSSKINAAPVSGGNDIPADSINLNFVFKSGTEGYACYRIPAIVTVKNGDVLVFAEGRKNGCGDAGDIDLLMKRSTDGGKSWSASRVIWSDSTNTCGNPAPIVDKETGQIFLFSTWNRGEDHEKQIIDLSSKDTRRVFVLTSNDQGKSWSAPREITSTVKSPNWTWYATGPCHGIQILNGKYKGRLVMPVNHMEKVTNKDYVSAVYSDDHGLNWTIGNNTPQELMNECTVVELSNGNLMMNIRNYDKKIRMRRVSISTDGGVNWGDVRTDSALIEPICQGSLLRYPLKGKKFALLFSNPDHDSKRENVSVKLSLDEGKTWISKKSLHAGPSAYSDLTVLRNGDIGSFYEAGFAKPYEGIVFHRFKYDELVKK